MKNVDLIRAAHQVIVAYGRASADAWAEDRNRCSVLLPIAHSAVDINELLTLIRTFEFVESAEIYEWMHCENGGLPFERRRWHLTSFAFLTPTRAVVWTRSSRSCPRWGPV